MTYVDGFLIPVPKDKVDAYRDVATTAAKIWMEHGALSVIEAQADDVSMGELTSFPRAVQQKDDETVFFSYITYTSREHRDAVNKKVIEDPRLNMDMANMPFDGKRMIFGGFKSVVEM